ncbi:NLR family CARD domain-containing protein 3-like [Myxocyprinus asiaticus]|uniref:NLR family CARD domain-containing protein 3-like n=1 Tax=Myxocyprinus asiaticus TaxID=70543 RepID=UPI0022218382|nr:NLR family CARD domain-containing protein 3-like [Myxocyprinus asiaticus]
MEFHNEGAEIQKALPPKDESLNRGTCSRLESVGLISSTMEFNLEENTPQDQTTMNNQSEQTHSLFAAKQNSTEEIQTMRSLLQDMLRRQYEGTLKATTYIPLKMYLSKRTHLDAQLFHEMQELERPFNEVIKEENVINHEDLLKPHSSTQKPVRTVLIRGISGSGKSTAVGKLVLDWAHGKTHLNIDFVFPLFLSELNILYKNKYSLVQFLDLLFPKIPDLETLKHARILFICDGLGEFRLPLNFKHAKTCFNPLEPVSLDCLLVNLLRGNLIPSAQILVTSKLKDPNLIPPEHVQRVVEVHGFDDLQWEEHIKREVHDQSIAARVIVHVKSSRTLYIMRSLPFFGQMAATVLEELFSNSSTTDTNPPLTLTEMFTHFILIQMKRQAVQERSTRLGTEEILKLGRLAWHMLEKDMLTFMEKDFRETDIDPLHPDKLSENMPMLFREWELMNLGKTYRFMHPSFQEYLAALYVAVHYKSSKGNVMSFTLAERVEKLLNPTEVPLEMSRRAMNRAFRSKTGQLDVFLLFLLGISAGPSKNLLSGFLQNSSCDVRKEDIVSNIVKKIQVNPLYEISVNLFRCLEELDLALPVVANRGQVEFERNMDTQFSPSQWSHVASTLLTSEDSLVTFDVRKYTNADEAIMRLLPVIKISRVLRLDEGTDLSWALLASALTSPANHIKEIDIEKKAMYNLNLKFLSVGLGSLNCKVEILRIPHFHKLSSKDADPLVSALSLNPTHLRELNILRSFHLSDRTVQSFSQTLVDPRCHLKKLALRGESSLSLEGCKILAAALCSSSCHLRELDLSKCFQSSDEDQAVQLLSEAFRDPNCKITVLRLAFYYVNQEALSALFSAFQDNPSHLKELSLIYYRPNTVEFQQLFSLLADPCFKLETLRIVHHCLSSAGSLETLASVLGLCSLRCLDLSLCGLKDSSVELLSSGLCKTNCKLEILRMTHCHITEVGAACLARALRSNPLIMREIDLSINPVKGPGFDQLRSVAEDPATRLKKLIVDGLEEHRDMETLRQYACRLTWDPNTASAGVLLSEKDTNFVHRSRKQEPIPFHPERFKVPNQIMSREGLSGRHFYQVEWFGRFATIGMTYKHISRKGSFAACSLGFNKESWGISVSTPSPICCAHHGGVEIQLPDCSPWRVGVYLDWPAGTLSFYNTTNDTAKLIHTFHAKFTHPLFLLVCISAGAQLLAEEPPPVCCHDHDPWDMFRGFKDCKGCNGSKAL